MTNNNIFKLTKRELEISELIINGYTNQQIANSIGINLCTAKVHVSSIMHKIQAKNRVNACFILVTHLKSEKNML